MWRDKCIGCYCDREEDTPYSIVLKEDYTVGVAGRIWMCKECTKRWGGNIVKSKNILLVRRENASR